MYCPWGVANKVGKYWTIKGTRHCDGWTPGSLQDAGFDNETQREQTRRFATELSEDIKRLFGDLGYPSDYFNTYNYQFGLFLSLWDSVSPSNEKIFGDVAVYESHYAIVSEVLARFLKEHDLLTDEFIDEILRKYVFKGEKRTSAFVSDMIEIAKQLRVIKRDMSLKKTNPTRFLAKRISRIDNDINVTKDFFRANRDKLGFKAEKDNKEEYDKLLDHLAYFPITANDFRGLLSFNSEEERVNAIVKQAYENFWRKKDHSLTWGKSWKEHYKKLKDQLDTHLVWFAKMHKQNPKMSTALMQGVNSISQSLEAKFKRNTLKDEKKKKEKNQK